MAQLLQLKNASKSFATKTLFDQASFTINPGEHIGVIGANGAGKTTLFKVLIDEIELDEGEVAKSSGLRIGYLPQESRQRFELTAEDVIAQDSLLGIWDLKKLGRGLGLKEEHFSAPYNSLSGGYRMRCLLLKLLGQEPNVLLLDEPTNYLDLESLITLEKFLLSYKGAFLLISHDREFLKRTTDHTLEVELGSITKFSGHIEDYFEQKALLREHLQKTAQSLEAQKQTIQKFADKFRAKASKAKQVQSRLKKLEKMPEVAVSALPTQMQMKVPEPTRIGKQALEVVSANLGYGEKTILSDIHFTVGREEHIAIVGVNGAGKSTLLKGLAGELPPQSGTIKQGLNVKIGYYAQHVSEALDPNSTVYEEMAYGAHPDVLPQEIKDLAGSFLFQGDDIHKKISVLSGGEKARVSLSKILLSKAPVLLLDEPTNHLDFHTVETLTEALRKSQSTVITVSHDRSFVQRIAHKIVEIRDGRAELYPGTYEEYLWSLERGAWSDKESPESQSSATERSQKTKEKKFNYKEEKKRLSKEIKIIEKALSQNEEDTESLKSEIQNLNQELLQTSGSEASDLARKISEKTQRVETLEEEWLSLEDQKEKLTESLDRL